MIQSQALRYNTSLRTLDLSSCNLTMAHLEALSRALTTTYRRRSQQTFDIPVTAEVVEQYGLLITDACNTSAKNRQDETSSCQEYAADLQTCQNAFSGVSDDGSACGSHLTSLNLTKNVFAHERAGSVLASMMFQAYALRSLDLTACLSMSPLHAHRFCEAMRAEDARSWQCNITSLTLDENLFSAEGMRLLAAVILDDTDSGVWRRLTSLSLVNCGIDAGGALAMADHLRQNRTLKRLSLANNRVSDEGFTAICRAVQSNTRLRELLLANNQISSAGAAPLVRMLEVNCALQSLDLTANTFGAEGAEDLSMFLKKTAQQMHSCMLFPGTNAEDEVARVVASQSNREARLRTPLPAPYYPRSSVAKEAMMISRRAQRKDMRLRQAVLSIPEGDQHLLSASPQGMSTSAASRRPSLTIGTDTPFSSSKALTRTKIPAPISVSPTVNLPSQSQGCKDAALGASAQENASATRQLGISVDPSSMSATDIEPELSPLHQELENQADDLNNGCVIVPKWMTLDSSTPAASWRCSEDRVNQHSLLMPPVPHGNRRSTSLSTNHRATFRSGDLAVLSNDFFTAEVAKRGTVRSDVLARAFKNTCRSNVRTQIQSIRLAQNSVDTFLLSGIKTALSKIEHSRRRGRFAYEKRMRKVLSDSRMSEQCVELQQQVRCT